MNETARDYVSVPGQEPAPGPVPFRDADAVERLEKIEEEIVLLAAHLHAGEHRFLTLIAEFDRLRGWEAAGHRSCAHWLAFRTGFDLGACRERIRAARALVKLPLTSASMSRGELSFSAVRALTRVATPENESDLLDLARGATTAQLERMVRGFKLGSRQDEADREKERFESREDGTRVSAETSRRLSCDAAVVEIGHARDGSVLDVGRKTRTIPPSVRRALEVRDRGCRFPGCGLRFTDAHHIKHWADGGESRLDNLLLLCSHHHRLLHEKGWKVEWWAEGQAAFIDPRGQTHMGRPREAPELDPNPVEHLIEDTRSRGADPDFNTAGASWKREADIPDDVYFRATEALG